jgi:hypothetical protein
LIAQLDTEVAAISLVRDEAYSSQVAAYSIAETTTCLLGNHLAPRDHSAEGIHDKRGQHPTFDVVPLLIRRITRHLGSRAEASVQERCLATDNRIGLDGQSGN